MVPTKIFDKQCQFNHLPQLKIPLFQKEPT